MCTNSRCEHGECQNCREKDRYLHEIYTRPVIYLTADNIERKQQREQEESRAFDRMQEILSTEHMRIRKEVQQQEQKREIILKVALREIIESMQEKNTVKERKQQNASAENYGNTRSYKQASF